MGVRLKHPVRKYLLVAGKTLVLLVLLALVASQAHWRDYQGVGADGVVATRPGLFTCLIGFSPLFFIVAAALQLLTIYLTAYRWRLLMLVQGIVLDRRSVLRLSYLGEFFNNFLPGALSGDAIKAIYVMRHTGKKGATLVSIFANRFVGLLVMVGLSVVMLGGWIFFSRSSGLSLKQPVFAIFLIAIAISVVLIVALNERLNNSRALQRLISRLPFSHQLEVLREAMHRHRNMEGMLLPVVLYSALIVVAFILSVMVVGMGLGINLAWYHYFLYLPLIMIMTAVPITPGGVGVMEELFIYFFSSAGDPQKVLAMALLYRLILIVCGLPGVVIFFASEKISREKMTENMPDLGAEFTGAALETPESTTGAAGRDSGAQSPGQ